MPLCECGCGNWTPTTWLKGHNWRGKAREFTDEYRQKLSKAGIGNTRALGHTHTEEWREQASAMRLGHQVSEETRHLIGEAHRGRRVSEEGLQRMREAQAGPSNVSEETRQKLSVIGLKAWQNPGYRQRMREIRSGRILSGEHRQAISRANMGKVRSEEVRLDYSRASKKRWQDPDYAAMMTKAFHRRPTQPEQRIIEIIEAYGLPLHYNGNNGRISIGGKVPDFVATDGSQRLIEVNGDYWHQDLQKHEERKQLFTRNGYTCLFLWADALEDLTDDRIPVLFDQLTIGVHLEVE